MKVITVCLLVVAMLIGCGVEEGIKRNDERYLKPGALDLPLTNYYDVYAYQFLGRYRITHEWPTSAGACNYRSLPTLNRRDRFKGEVFAVPEIYEENGKTWQRSNTGRPPMDFDRYVRSVRIMNPVVYNKVTGKRIEGASEEIEAGLQSLCHQSWYATQHGLSMLLRKWSVDQYLTWLKTNAQQPGRVSQQRIGTNNWTVLEFNLEPQSTDGASSGPYQFWLLPIGETGYTFLFRLGANLESIKHSEAHTRMQAMFRQLIESVKIEPLRP